ncbi:hypothetical protein TVAG_317200 [Trichomonas vaginalis G3]|uniref:Uncharacterized protein n=1 Tax=Trichomonas vaginalis (strain ATCC PRA-98 / G3) TaxID=412133 RepID=A2FQZ5_TRIV3|nr:hypothetical protein TVAGG3_0744340 [Trichomonas vaginalis G3]EAX92662.1 hypothetical protein TVAG_317200 [Trichomonas vaginalis G3]KAI5512056.1 hypothetical protein TVAGG3_0744340 [Trichomonas vaginalis G3]|eukprot:XP_001305592.1 hypothetical protein [Trichomonas vaginalis G3]
MNTSYHYEITYFAAYVIAYPRGTGIINFTTASNTSSTEDGGGIYNYGNFNITKCNFLNNEYPADVILSRCLKRIRLVEMMD